MVPVCVSLSLYGLCVSPSLFPPCFTFSFHSAARKKGVLLATCSARDVEKNDRAPALQDQNPSNKGTSSGTRGTPTQLTLTVYLFCVCGQGCGGMWWGMATRGQFSSVTCGIQKLNSGYQACMQRVSTHRTVSLTQQVFDCV